MHFLHFCITHIYYVLLKVLALQKCSLAFFILNKLCLKVLGPSIAELWFFFLRGYNIAAFILFNCNKIMPNANPIKTNKIWSWSFDIIISFFLCCKLYGDYYINPLDDIFTLQVLIALHARQAKLEGGNRINMRPKYEEQAWYHRITNQSHLL